MPVAKPPATPAIKVKVQKKQARFRRVRDANSPHAGVGEFFLLLDVAAPKEDVYVPISIASGKKPVGFIYQIEGTKEGSISTTTISCSGAGVTQITLGTLLYAKIPAGKTATFRILIEMRGKTGSEYGITIVQINYKRDLAAARYEKFLEPISGKTVKFG